MATSLWTCHWSQWQKALDVSTQMRTTHVSSSRGARMARRVADTVRGCWTCSVTAQVSCCSIANLSRQHHWWKFSQIGHWTLDTCINTYHMHGRISPLLLWARDIWFSTPSTGEAWCFPHIDQHMLPTRRSLTSPQNADLAEASDRVCSSTCLRISQQTDTLRAVKRDPVQLGA